jgi:hypothetical protein
MSIEDNPVFYWCPKCQDSFQYTDPIPVECTGPEDLKGCIFELMTGHFSSGLLWCRRISKNNLT